MLTPFFIGIHCPPSSFPFGDISFNVSFWPSWISYEPYLTPPYSLASSTAFFFHSSILAFKHSASPFLLCDSFPGYLFFAVLAIFAPHSLFSLRIPERFLFYGPLAVELARPTNPPFASLYLIIRRFFLPLIRRRSPFTPPPFTRPSLQSVREHMSPPPP